MKGCFVLQRRFVYIGHEIARFLKTGGVVDEFCCYVQVRDGYNFLKKQHDIAYTGLILDEEMQKQYVHEPLDREYLARLEKEIGPLSRFIKVDRVLSHGQLIREYPYDRPLFSEDVTLRILQTFARRIERFLDEQKPDFVFGYIFGSMSSLLLYELAKKRNIPVFSVLVPSTEHLVCITESLERLTGVEALVARYANMAVTDIPSYAKARAFLDRFRDKPFAYSQVVMSREKQGKWQQFAFLKPDNLLWSLYFNFIKQFTDWFADADVRSDYTTPNPFLRLIDVATRKIRNAIGLEDLYDNFEGASYIFYPLQYEPEVTLLLHARGHTDQQKLITEIAAALPDGMMLYVKEHPAMVPYRTRDFYKRIKAIPRVRLVPPETSSFELTRSASLIATINSSVGWEATLLGKPVVTFGDVFYNALPSVKQFDSSDLRELFQKHMNSEAREDDVLRYLACMFEDCVAFDLMYLWEVETDEEKRRSGFKIFADLLARKLAGVNVPRR